MHQPRNWTQIVLPVLVLGSLAAGLPVLERQRDEQLLSDSLQLGESVDGETVCVEFLEATVTVRQLEYLRRYPQLRRLDFSGTVDLEGRMDSLRDFAELTTIDLSETQWLNESMMKIIADAPNLSSVTLNGSNISDSGLAALTAHPAVQFLHLADCGGISDQSIDTLTSLQSLELVVLATTGITPKGFRQLRDARRDLAIYYSPDPQRTGIALNGNLSTFGRIRAYPPSWRLHQICSSAATADLVEVLTSPHDWSTGRWTSTPSLRDVEAIELSGPTAAESLNWLAPRVRNVTSIDTHSAAARELTEFPLASLRSAYFHDFQWSRGLQPLGEFPLLTSLSFEVTGPLDVEQLPNLTQMPPLQYLTLNGPHVDDAIIEWMVRATMPIFLALEVRGPPKADALRNTRGWEGLRSLKLKCPGERTALICALSQLGDLRRLELELTSNLDPDILPPPSRLPRLAEIELRGRGMDEFAVGYLSRLASPTSLGLEVRAPLGPSALQDFKAWQNLERITLKGAGVDDSLIRALAHMDRLESLHLEITSSLAKDALQPLSELPHLQYLTLEGPGVTDALVASTTQLPAIKYLSLYCAPVSDAGVSLFLERPRPLQILADQTCISPAMLQQLNGAQRGR